MKWIFSTGVLSQARAEEALNQLKCLVRQGASKNYQRHDDVCDADLAIIDIRQHGDTVGSSEKGRLKFLFSHDS